jgi:hypothetical protein
MDDWKLRSPPGSETDNHDVIMRDRTPDLVEHRLSEGTDISSLGDSTIKGGALRVPIRKSYPRVSSLS